ncbi:nitrous oxide-stimulated promoter family protein [Ferrimonas marina]|uniref:Nitrous oxide-stimulated promoter n=1 Tax=Ferrimonas marina TaxID=299255 RepID=A0A1M5XQS7_9GAMM|nr:nitrous oxide-stimulated promoter family protein [Ferrimonas marina]SHI02106.1 Nitrous oxide-stimulated promoter [Ferrimonas marina]
MKNTKLTGRLAREHDTLGKMMAIYCRSQCGSAPRKQGLCSQCQALLDYAETKLDRCPYGDQKPTCAKCPIHCYKPEPREQVRAAMRFAGPRMLLRHPIAAIRHLIDDRREVPKKPPMRANRRRSQASQDPQE